MWFVGVEVEQETSAPPPKKFAPVKVFFQIFDMDKLGKIQRYHWKDRVNQ